MKKIIIFSFVFLLMLGLASAATVERSISGGVVTLTISGYEGRYGGIISEVLPSGYSSTGLQSQSVGVDGSASGRQEGQTFSIAFAASTNPATVTYGVEGSGGGDIQGTFELAENMGSGQVSGESTLNEDISGSGGINTTLIILAIAGIAAYFLLKKK